MMRAPTDPRLQGSKPSAEAAASRLRLLQRPYRVARRIGVAVVGSAVLGVGLVLLVTPGPAFVVIPVGLGILALEFEWAARWLGKIKDRFGKLATRVRRPPGEPGPV
jgi:tellurite resistance protein TerC